MKKVALHNLGCKVNSYELDVMGQKLQESGFLIVPFDEMADIYIVNTCSVTNMADRKSRQMLHQAKKRNPKAIIVATGCYAQTGTDKVKSDEAVDLIIGNNRKKDVVTILQEYMGLCAETDRDFQGSEENASPEIKLQQKTLNDTTVIDINHTDEYEEMTLKTTTEHTRAYIKIQDGCNQFCSYCIIPYARGRVRSRQEEDIIAEVKGLVKNGYREVVLTGIHISSYGMDFDGKKNPVGLEPFDHKRLLLLMQKLNEIDGLERIRLGSLEPRIITKEFVEGMLGITKLCAHFHLSLQSGCDETLKRMNRHYTTEEYYEKVQLLRAYFDNPAITTDVITGFPGETEEEFAQTKAFLEKICFYETHVFPYSKRQGTVAAARKDQVDEAIKKQRSAVLLKLDEQNAKNYRESFVGQTVNVLFEETKEIQGRLYQIGHTDKYVMIAKETAENLSGQITGGTVKGFLQDDILEI
ncbi:MAG: tRNA (N(6)-L-threonylcarbamoyladenosine(37)-C(2))-methylthiotransferase MtaB [Lachnospiraceae bacterium]|nr:tRNA (N(6)-L-threonylcarbamoyladenosine(37)-C(2))-methylthiotransferase MtaB [Lachnospiraceae bacterium]